MMFAMTGKLLRITTFTSSGTWTRKDDVGSILIKAVGAGGDSLGAGGASGMAGCSAGGGGRGYSTGTMPNHTIPGGSGSGGDINVSGATGRQNQAYCPPSIMYGKGIGGINHLDYYGSGGGYTEKFVNDPSPSYAVTVGSTSSRSHATFQTGGIVIVYEFAK